MAKKQKEETAQGGTLPQVDIISKRTSNGYQYLGTETLERLSNPNYIPGHLQAVLNPWVREKRKEFDIFTEIMETVDKASDKYTAASSGREKVANAFIMAKNQIEDYKRGTRGLKDALGAMSSGTQDANLYTNMLVFGAQADAANFDNFGKLNFAAVYGEGPNDISTFNLDDVSNPLGGGSPIVTEPYETKTFIWELAEETKQNQINGKPFDEEWMYTRLYNDLTERGTQNNIGVAFADLAGDNQTKSFAEQYDDGLADPMFYIDPETGKPLPRDSSWMKDPQYGDVLKKFLGKYITNIMKDVYGTIDEDTGQLKRTKSEIARELIEKYSK